MKTNDFEQLLKAAMNADDEGSPSPDPLLVFEARQTVMARRRPAAAIATKTRHLFTALLPLFRVQHIGMATLLIAGCMLYVSEITGYRHNERAFSDTQDFPSISSNTISVISSTMLTSIPTLRN